MDLQQMDGLQAGDVVVVGIPFDKNSSFLRGPALAPQAIRRALYSGSGNLCAENGLDLGAGAVYQDLGDLPLHLETDAFEEITQVTATLMEKQVRLLSLGGDHSITYPVIKGYARRYTSLTVFVIDAHPDLYDSFDGNRLSHACPFSRIMEEKLAVRLVQVGIRTHTPHTRAQAERFGVETIEMKDWRPGRAFSLSGPIYLSIDLDGLDPAFAPGVSHYEPGGLTTREVVDMIQGLKGMLVGADIVEMNPLRDPQGITAMVAAKLMKEIISKMVESL